MKQSFEFAAAISADLVRAAEPALLSRVRLRARRRALWLRTLWASDENATGLAITHTEADRIMAEPSTLRRAEIAFYESNGEARELSRRIVLADKAAEEDERWQRLHHLFKMTDAESDLFAVAVLVAVDPAFGRACAYLQDDATAAYATPFVARGMFDWPCDASIPSGSVLLRWRLVSVPENLAFYPNAPSTADASIVQWLLGGPAIDPLLDTAVEFIARTDVQQLECLDPATLAKVDEFLNRLLREAKNGVPIEIELIAPDGAGKRTLAAQACAGLGRDLVVADVRALQLGELAYPQRMDRIVRVARLARLQDAVLYWNHVESIDARTRQALGGLADLTFFGSDILTLQEPSAHGARQQFALNVLRPSQRLKLWQQYTAAPAPTVIGEWELRPAEIRAAARSANAGHEAVLSACRRMLHREPGELLTSMKCPYTWNDIVLTSEVRKQLEELQAQARLRDQVLEQWGFDRLCPMGRGISALFAGPSGTGKTMAAQVLARELSRELLRVDLAGVVNKYIGETEKRLRLVFEMCERSAVVLFFDEADALFGQRTQVKDAHDRYANIQIDYLLQRMEQFDGVAILASNRKNDLDSAFLRRLRFIVDFHPPGPSERVTLWRLALPERSPAGEELLDEIDWSWLGEKLIMTGADIKATALAAAFLARAEGSRIRTEHLLHAAHREMTKHGTVWRAGDWRGKSRDGAHA